MYGAQMLEVTTCNQGRTILNARNISLPAQRKSLQEENVLDKQTRKKMEAVPVFSSHDYLAPSPLQSILWENGTTHSSCIQKKTERQLRCLAFQNPGPLLAEFNPETRLQTKEIHRIKLRQLVFENNAVGQRKYDGNGRLLLNGMDLCDCLDKSCPGCFYACSKCSSWKCGSTCRCNRKWIYDGIETEGTGVVQKFPNLDSN